MRRIVTGHNKEGKSIINIDGPPARSLGEDVGGLFELWNTDGKDVNSLDATDRADSEVILSPPSGGTKFRYFQINPLMLYKFFGLNQSKKNIAQTAVFISQKIIYVRKEVLRNIIHFCSYQDSYNITHKMHFFV